MKITIELRGTSLVQRNIDALTRVIDGKPKTQADDMLILDTISILKAIKVEFEK